MIQDNSATFPPANSPVVNQNGNLTQTWMGFFRALFNRTGMGTGIPFQVQSVSFSLTDVQLSVTADWVLITEKPATAFQQSLVLPELKPGQFIIVENIAANNVDVFAQSDQGIDGGHSYTVPSMKMQIFWCFTTTQIFSTQLG